jgi:hypothetical protein
MMVSGGYSEQFKEAPAIRVSRDSEEPDLTPYIRRSLCVDFKSHFTGNQAEVDESNFVFKADPTLRDFLRSPVARHCRFRHHLLPLMTQYTLEEMIEFLNDPGEEILAATKELCQLMAKGGVLDQAPKESDDIDLSRAKETLTEFHCQLAIRGNIVKNYIIKSSKVIEGAMSDKSTKKPTKLENFRKLVDTYGYLFEPLADGSGYRKLSVNLKKFEAISKNDVAGLVGQLEDYPCVFGTKAAVTDAYDADCGDFFLGEKDGDGVSVRPAGSRDVPAGRHVEVINEEKLREYCNTKNDRRQPALSKFVRNLSRNGFTDEVGAGRPAPPRPLRG